MPNYRAVSEGANPPPAPKQAFKIAGENSFYLPHLSLSV
jgi:hypothetical protein